MKDRQNVMQDNLDNLCPSDFELLGIANEEREPDQDPDPMQGYNGTPNDFNSNVDYAKGNYWWE